MVGNSWWQLAVAVFLAVISPRSGSLATTPGTGRLRHPAGQLRRRVLLGNLGIGLSYGWWVDKHNRHHAHPNTEDADPDISVSGAFAFTSRPGARQQGHFRLLLRYQAYLFFPLLRWKGSICMSRASRR